MFISYESFNEKTAENNQNRYVAEKRMVPKLSNISVSNSNSTYLRQNLTCLTFILYEK